MTPKGARLVGWLETKDERAVPRSLSRVAGRDNGRPEKRREAGGIGELQVWPWGTKGTGSRQREQGKKGERIGRLAVRLRIACRPWGGRGEERTARVWKRKSELCGGSEAKEYKEQCGESCG